MIRSSGQRVIRILFSPFVVILILEVNYNKMHGMDIHGTAFGRVQVQVLLQWFEKQQDTMFCYPFVLISAFIFSTLILLRLIKGAWAQNPTQPPSPPRLPIIGNFHQLGSLPHRSLHDLSQKHGSLMSLRLGRIPAVIVSSAEMAREFKHTNDAAFSNRPLTTASELLFYGGIDMGFAPYGEYWRQLRKICVLELLSTKRVHSFKLVRDIEVARMIASVSSSCLLQVPVNLTDMLLAFSNNVVSRCAFGKISDGDKKFGELAREFLQLLGAFSVGDFFPRFKWMDTVMGLHRKMKKVSRELDTFLDQVINEHLAHDREDFVGLLLRVQKDNLLDIEFARDNIKALILDMFVGGTDTASTTIEWAMAELVRNPNVMKKAQEEVRRVAGKKPKLDEEDIHHMDYLKSVFKETLRLHAPIPLVPLESKTSTEVKSYHLPAKTRVIINIWAIQRDAATWECPEEFIPERFSNSPIDFRGQDYEYIPFGSGRRGCPGMSFGVAVVELAIANLIYWFDWELPGGVELDMCETFGSTVSKRMPLHLVPSFHFSQFVHKT